MIPQVGDSGQYGYQDAKGNLRPIAAIVTELVPAEVEGNAPQVELHTLWPPTIHALSGDPALHRAVPVAPTLTAGCWSPVPLNPELADRFTTVEGLEPVHGILQSIQPETHVHVHLEDSRCAGGRCPCDRAARRRWVEDR